MISRKIITVIVSGIFLSILISNYSLAQTTEAYRPPDAFAASTGPSPTPTAQSCNGHCSCYCTDPRCNNMPWTYFTSDSSVTVTQCQQNCVTAANEYCASMHPGTTTSSTEAAPYATP